MIDELRPYTKVLNSYNAAHYPANKKISAEEWNALWLAVFTQGNHQEDVLARIINEYLPTGVDAINGLITLTDGHTTALLGLRTDVDLNIANIEALETYTASLDSDIADLSSVVSEYSSRITATESNVAAAVNDAAEALDIAEGIDAKATLALSTSGIALSNSENALAIAQGKSQSLVFNTLADMQLWLADITNLGTHNVGDSLYLKAADVPDYWITEVLTEADSITGYYYAVEPYEAKLPDITNMLTTDTVQNIEALKTFNVDPIISAIKNGDYKVSVPALTKDEIFATISDLITNHNDLSNIQGGGLAERYHLDLAQYTKATQAASTTLDGYLSAADFVIFNNKEDMLPETPNNPSVKFLNGNREWEEIAIGSGDSSSNVYLTNAPSSTSGAFRALSYTNQATTTEYIITVNNNEVIIQDFLFDIPLGVSVIPAGNWNATMHGKVSSTAGEARYRFEVYKYSSIGVATPLFTVPIYSDIIDSTEYHKVRIATTQGQFTVDPTDRLGVSIFAKNNVAAAVDVYLSLGDDTASWFTTPLGIKHAQVRGLNEDPLIQHITTTQETNFETAYAHSQITDGSNPHRVSYSNILNKPTIPTQASDIGALPDTTKYGATVDLTYTALTGELEVTLKDQDGTTLNSKKVDLPLELIITSGTVETCTVINTPVAGYVVGDKYLDLVLANGGHIYVLVSDLVDQITITETGTGNAVTDISINGSVITETKGKTFVETNRTVAGKALSSDITLASSDLTDSANLIKGATIYGGTISDNLNTITKSGLYTCYGTATGVPNTSYSWFVLHENSNAGTASATQKAVAYNSSEVIVFIRVKMGSTWGDWVQLEMQSNKVTTISSSSTDKEYASAKCLYDIINGLVDKTTAQEISAIKTFTNGSFHFKNDNTTIRFYNSALYEKAGIFSDEYSQLYIYSNGGIIFRPQGYSDSHGMYLLGENIAPETDNYLNLGITARRFKNLFLSGTIGDGTNTFTLPTSTGTLALTSDIPSVSDFLVASNIKAGTNITLSVSGKDVTINSTGGATVTVVDNLTSTSTTSALSANQGKVLNDNKVPNTRTVAGKALSANITLASTDLTDTANIARLNAPTNIGGTEQATAKFMTSNGGSLTIGKEGPNSGTMLRFDQVDGTERLRFRSSATAGAMVWSQLEANAALYMDLADSTGVTERITFKASQLSHPVKLSAPTVQTTTLTNGTYNYTLPSATGTLALTSQLPTLSSLGVTATAAELNHLDGITATVTELNYTGGVTSAIQTQLNGKANKDASNITASSWVSALLTGAAGYGDKIVSKSLGATGYIKYASGLIIQWGSISGSYLVTATLPIAMTSTNYRVMLTPEDSSAQRFYAPHLVSKTKSSMVIYVDDARTVAINYFVVGY